jgi:hypothetical protein
MLSLKILPVKKLPDTLDTKKKKELDERLPKPPFLMVVQAPVRSGKTNFIINLLYNDNFYRGHFEDVLYISPTIANDDTGKAVMDDEEVIKITENLEDIDLILESIVELQKQKDKKDRKQTLVVLDDMLGLIKSQGQSYFATLCSKYRHFRLSLIICSQNFRSIPVTARCNSTVYIIFKTNNKKELAKMEEEFDGNFPFAELYEYATKERYNFLYLDNEKIKAYKNFDELIYDKDDQD